MEIRRPTKGTRSLTKSFVNFQGYCLREWAANFNHCVRKGTTLIGILLTIAAALLFIDDAWAHQIQVMMPSTTIDVGLARPAQLIHTTLKAKDDHVKLTVETNSRSSSEATQVFVMLPDQSWELNLKQDQLPQVLLDGHVLRLTTDGKTKVDETTGIGYRVAASTILREGSGKHLIEIHRGTSPARVALRIGKRSDPFAALNIDHSPRASIRTQLWAETVPGGHLANQRKARVRKDYALFGVALTLGTIMLSAWWVWTGRKRARQRTFDGNV